MMSERVLQLSQSSLNSSLSRGNRSNSSVKAGKKYTEETADWVSDDDNNNNGNEDLSPEHEREYDQLAQEAPNTEQQQQQQQQQQHQQQQQQQQQQQHQQQQNRAYRGDSSASIYSDLIPPLPPGVEDEGLDQSNHTTKISNLLPTARKERPKLSFAGAGAAAQQPQAAEAPTSTAVPPAPTPAMVPKRAKAKRKIFQSIKQAPSLIEQSKLARLALDLSVHGAKTDSNAGDEPDAVGFGDDDDDDDDDAADRWRLGDPLHEKRGLGPTRNTVGRIVNWRPVQWFLMTLVVTNALLLGAVTFLHDRPDIVRKIDVADMVFLVIFTVEIVMQIFYLGLRFFRQGWLVFDALIVGLSWGVVGSLTIMRSFRVFRIFAMVSRWKSLKILFHAMGKTLPKMGTIAAMLGILFYAFSVFYTNIYYNLYEEGITHVDYFGRLDLTFLTLFQVMTMDSWTAMVRQVMEVNPWAWIGFCIWVVISAFFFVNMIVAVICEALFELNGVRDRKRAARMLAGQNKAMKDQTTTLLSETQQLMEMQKEMLANQIMIQRTLMEVVDTLKQNSKDQARTHGGQGVQPMSSIRSINVGSICEEDDELSMDMCDSSTLSGHTDGTTKGEMRRKKMVKALSKFKRNTQSTSSTSLGLGNGRLRNFHRRKSDESKRSEQRRRASRSLSPDASRTQRQSSQNDLMSDGTSQTESEADLPTRREDWSRESSMKRSFAVRQLSVSKEDILLEDDTDPNEKDLQQAVKRGSENANTTIISDPPPIGRMRLNDELSDSDSGP